MRKVLQVISMLALVLTVAPSIMFLAGRIDLEKMKFIMMAATLVWFAVTPFWMGREKVADAR